LLIDVGSYVFFVKICLFLFLFAFFLSVISVCDTWGAEGGLKTFCQVLDTLRDLPSAVCLKVRNLSSSPKSDKNLNVV
jgi:hypothetical protein